MRIVLYLTLSQAAAVHNALKAEIDVNVDILRDDLDEDTRTLTSKWVRDMRAVIKQLPDNVT